MWGLVPLHFPLIRFIKCSESSHKEKSVNLGWNNIHYNTKHNYQIHYRVSDSDQLLTSTITSIGTANAHIAPFFGSFVEIQQLQGV